MTCKLYINTSQNNVAEKSIEQIGNALTCDFIVLDVNNPQFIVNGLHGDCNYVYIPYLDRYYYARATLLSNKTTKLDCKCDVLMTANKRGNIYGTSQYVARCETETNTNLIDSLIPIKNEYRVYGAPVSTIPDSAKNIIVGVIS